MDETESGNTFEWITANTAGMQNFLQGSRLTKVLHGFVMFYKVLQGSSAVCWMCIIEMRSNPCRTLPFDDSVLQGGPPAVWWGVQEVDPCWQVPSLLLCLPSPGIKQILKQNGESRLEKEGEKKDSEFYENDTLPHVKISVLHPASLAREQGLRAFQVVVGHLCLNKQREKLGLKIRSNCVFTIGNCHISYQRYHKRPWSLRAWIDKGRSKSCIVEVGT